MARCTASCASRLLSSLQIQQTWSNTWEWNIDSTSPPSPAVKKDCVRRRRGKAAQASFPKWHQTKHYFRRVKWIKKSRGNVTFTRLDVPREANWLANWFYSYNNCFILVENVNKNLNSVMKPIIHVLVLKIQTARCGRSVAILCKLTSLHLISKPL